MWPKAPQTGDKTAPGGKVQPAGGNGASPQETSDPYVRVINKTARRIGIDAHNGNDRLIISAFGSRRIPQSAQKEYDTDPWYQRGLIDIEEELSKSTNEADDRHIALGCLIFWLMAGLVIVPLLVRLSDDTHSRIKYGLLMAYAAIALGTLIYGLGGDSAYKRVKELLNLLLIPAISLGIPSLVMYYSGSIFVEKSPALLGQGLQLFVIALFASLPGMFYFQYERQQVKTLRSRFLREIVLLNPGVHTTDDADTGYGSMVDEISGMVGANTRQYFLLGAGRPILLATLLLTLGWMIALPPTRDFGGKITFYECITPETTAISFAFLGTYLFALNLVFRRYTRGDLTPKAYSHIIVRIISAVILVWAISGVASFVDYDGDPKKAGLLLVAFIVGIFPETGITVLRDTANKISLKLAFGPLIEQNPITRLEGVNLYDYVRLLEEGVENIENLAHYNLIELMLRTRLPTSRLVDLVDQAILYLHVAQALEEENQDSAAEAGQKPALHALRAYGIRTATDLVQVVKKASSAEKEHLYHLLDAQDEKKPCRLYTILLAIQDDEWLDYLLHWRELNRSQGRVYSWEDFYSKGAIRLHLDKAPVSTPAPPVLDSSSSA